MTLSNIVLKAYIELKCLVFSTTARGVWKFRSGSDACFGETVRITCGFYIEYRVAVVIAEAPWRH
jgi:hypothetical protein